MRKTKKITLFGKDLLLSVRYASDVIDSSNFWNKCDKTPGNLVFLSAVILRDSLKVNIENVEWYKLIKKRELKKLLRLKNILSSIFVNELPILNEDILILEGVSKDDIKKGNYHPNINILKGFLKSILKYDDSDFDKMLITKFYEEFEVAIIIAHYQRGGELILNTSDDKRNKISEKIKKFKRKGLL